MPLLETDYCVEQIDVPPKLPMILKQFCKSAIRTQPYDLLKWSSAYFKALAEGHEPPTKLRLEYPPVCSAHGLTIGFLKVLLRQLGSDYNKILPIEKIIERWDQLCLDRRDSDLIIEIGRFHCKCQIKKFLSIAVGLLSRSMTETMNLICELFTFEPDGGSAMIPISLFMEIYGYLANLKCDGTAKDLCTCTESERDESEEKEVASMASQDTEADIDLELESLTKDDVPSAMTLQSFGEETQESFRHEGEASFRSIDRSLSSKSSKSADKVEIKKEETLQQTTSETMKEPSIVADKVEIKKEETLQQTTSETMKEPSIVESDASKKSLSKQSTKSEQSEPCYPDVPGIGRRLTAEEVAAVAIWMSECSRRQGGMVGPRNIRHINCPPLDGCKVRSRSQEDLLRE